MEAAVEQCSVDRKCCEIQQKQFLIENDRLLDKIISQDIVNIVLNSSVVICDYENKNDDSVVICNKCLELEAELLQAKDTVISKLKETIHSLRDNVNPARVKQDIDEIETINIELEHRMFKLDLEPLAPKVLKNKDAHIDYIKHSREHADTLWEIVKNSRALSPLDSNLDSACKYVQRIQEVLVYVKDTCPCLTKPTEKLVAVTPKNKDKKVRFADPVTSLSNTQKQPTCNTKNNRISQPSSSNKINKVEDQFRSVKYRTNKKNRVSKTECNVDGIHSMLNANSKSVCAICNECLFDATHDKCVLDYVHGVTVLSKSKPAKRKNKKQIWKPTGKVYNELGYKWKPTGRTFTIVRHKCPLTRFTSTKVVPIKETTIKSVLTPTPGIKVVQIVLWYLDSEYSKHMTGNRSQLTNFVNKFLGIVKFGNDQIAKIMGYGDYQIGNVTISRVC
ncbi:hypothetical protein Tco_1500037 [Tanacetum coccineum]